MSVKCPKCNTEAYSTSNVRTPGTISGIVIGLVCGGVKGAVAAAKKSGPKGAVMGGVAGAILGALTGAAAGAAAGHKLGETIDDDVVTEYYCPDCKKTFNLRKEMREAKEKQTNMGMAPGI